jgi:hypothetical protein
MWHWFVQTAPVAPPPNNGITDTLDEAKAAFKAAAPCLKVGQPIREHDPDDIGTDCRAAPIPPTSDICRMEPFEPHGTQWRS